MLLISGYHQKKWELLVLQVPSNQTTEEGKLIIIYSSDKSEVTGNLMNCTGSNFYFLANYIELLKGQLCYFSSQSRDPDSWRCLKSILFFFPQHVEFLFLY